ncbi:MAG: hypothetical protein MZV64_13550 [Ignavibacteriales bacterium]|nr:hypothetical protein [Ignavibacteriales bacterium]
MGPLRDGRTRHGDHRARAPGGAAVGAACGLAAAGPAGRDADARRASRTSCSPTCPMTFAVVLTLLLSLQGGRAADASRVCRGRRCGRAGGGHQAQRPDGRLDAARGGAGRRARPEPAAHLGDRSRPAAACVGAFFVTTPFALIDLPAFLNGFGTQAAAFSATVRRSAEASWRDLREAPEAGPLAGPPSLLAAGGRRPRRSTGPHAGPDRVTLGARSLVVPGRVLLPDQRLGLHVRALRPADGAASSPIWAAGRASSGSSMRAGGACRHPSRAQGGDGPRARSLAPSPARGVLVLWVRGSGHDTTQALAWTWMKKSIWPGLFDALRGPRARPAARAATGRRWCRHVADRHAEAASSPAGVPSGSCSRRMRGALVRRAPGDAAVNGRAGGLRSRSSCAAARSGHRDRARRPMHPGPADSHRCGSGRVDRPRGCRRARRSRSIHAAHGLPAALLLQRRR